MTNAPHYSMFNETPANAVENNIAYNIQYTPVDDDGDNRPEWVAHKTRAEAAAEISEAFKIYLERGRVDVFDPEFTDEQRAHIVQQIAIYQSIT